LILQVFNERGLLQDEEFGFRPKHSTSLTGAVFLDMAKAFDTVWIDGLLYKLTLLNFPSYLVHTMSSYLKSH